jgi:hypothetical protein
MQVSTVRALAAALGLAGVLACLAGCDSPTSPSKSAAGSWQAIGVGHSAVYGLSLEQRDDQISGTACYSDSGVILFRGVPVSGTYPRVLFASPSGTVFVGKLEEDRDQIAGDYGSVPLRFNPVGGTDPPC